MSRAIVLRPCIARNAADGSAMSHAEDEEWHPCMVPPGDEGGEAYRPTLRSFPRMGTSGAL